MSNTILEISLDNVIYKNNSYKNNFKYKKN